jgi:hypothetical protein
MLITNNKWSDWKRKWNEKRNYTFLRERPFIKPHQWRSCLVYICNTHTIQMNWTSDLKFSQQWEFRLWSAQACNYVVLKVIIITTSIYPADGGICSSKALVITYKTTKTNIRRTTYLLLQYSTSDEVSWCNMHHSALGLCLNRNVPGWYLN